MPSETIERRICNNTGKQWAKVKMADRFVHAWMQEGIGGDLTAEFQFDAEREWRFDLAFPSQKLAIEFDGAGWGHMTHKGRREDFEKRNAAVVLGWRILVYESSMLSLSRMLDVVCDVIDCLAPPEFTSGRDPIDLPDDDEPEEFPA